MNNNIGIIKNYTISYENNTIDIQLLDMFLVDSKSIESSIVLLYQFTLNKSIKCVIPYYMEHIMDFNARLLVPFSGFTTYADYKPNTRSFILFDPEYYTKIDISLGSNINTKIINELYFKLTNKSKKFIDNFNNMAKKTRIGSLLNFLNYYNSFINFFMCILLNPHIANESNENYYINDIDELTIDNTNINNIIERYFTNEKINSNDDLLNEIIENNIDVYSDRNIERYGKFEKSRSEYRRFLIDIFRNFIQTFSNSLKNKFMAKSNVQLYNKNDIMKLKIMTRNEAGKKISEYFTICNNGNIDNNGSINYENIQFISDILKNMFKQNINNDYYNLLLKYPNIHNLMDAMKNNSVCTTNEDIVYEAQAQKEYNDIPYCDISVVIELYDKLLEDIAKNKNNLLKNEDLQYPFNYIKSVCDDCNIDNIDNIKIQIETYIKKYDQPIKNSQIESFRKKRLDYLKKKLLILNNKSLIDKYKSICNIMKLHNYDSFIKSIYTQAGGENLYYYKYLKYKTKYHKLKILN